MARQGMSGKPLPVGRARVVSEMGSTVEQLCRPGRALGVHGGLIAQVIAERPVLGKEPVIPCLAERSRKGTASCQWSLMVQAKVVEHLRN